MRPGGSDYTWTGLNTSVYDHQDAFRIHSLKLEDIQNEQLADHEEIFGEFDKICIDFKFDLPINSILIGPALM